MKIEMACPGQSHATDAHRPMLTGTLSSMPLSVGGSIPTIVHECLCGWKRWSPATHLVLFGEQPAAPH